MRVVSPHIRHVKRPKFYQWKGTCQVKCKDCGGSGQYVELNSIEPCKTCDGEGKVVFYGGYGATVGEQKANELFALPGIDSRDIRGVRNTNVALIDFYDVDWISRETMEQVIAAFNKFDANSLRKK